ncbi:hypothetical protein PLIIFM63780_010315 [Purpureocillium lilacinum]|nr:hypothetical protein PLIIFM63780_010315 [Purpureocillium lilacinum]
MHLYIFRSALPRLLLLTALAPPALGQVLGAAPNPISAPRAVEANANEEGPNRVAIDIPTGGRVSGSTYLGVETFNGIPYADPPVGLLRLKPPQRLSSDPGDIDGEFEPPACPQMYLSSETLDSLGKIQSRLRDIPFLKTFLIGQEDCLTVNVQRPTGTKGNDKLPVLFWIYGGAFQLGGTNTYDARNLLATAMDQQQAFVFVSVNYRVGGFGFMPGNEVMKDRSANIGLLDQRLALEWVADNIAAFGGDPSKVTIWGQSAGAISVFDQMLLYGGNASYKGNPLFRGAIMNSGSAIPADPMNCPKGQAVYDAVVRAADGVVLPDNPINLIKDGRFYAVPFIIGDQEDEGTLFSFFQSNISSIDDITNYLGDLFFHNAPKDKLRGWASLYEPSTVKGSPFRTGTSNELYPGFKRMAAILGDVTFTLTRRLSLKLIAQVKPDIPSWSYISSYDYGTPFLGTFHASDLLQVFYGIMPNHAMKSTRTYYLNFIHHLDPNEGIQDYAHWPQWKDEHKLMWFRSADENDILEDNFRGDSAAFIENNTDILRI